jgi:predicted Na+-dependent transporter
LELHVARVPIMVQYLLEELLLPVVLGLVFNQWMANMDNLLIIILPPRL